MRDALSLVTALLVLLLVSQLEELVESLRQVTEVRHFSFVVLGRQHDWGLWSGAVSQGGDRGC